MSEGLAQTNNQMLIASSSRDIASWTPVAKLLGERGYDVVAYEADKVTDGSIPLHIRVDGERGMTVNYNGMPLCLDKIAAAWYRRPSLFAPEQPDKALQMSLDKERGVLQQALWARVPESKWLNAPGRISVAERKLTQLDLAARVGFTIPETVVSNDWNAVLTTLPPDIIFKPTFGYIHVDNSLRMQKTTLFRNTRDGLPLSSNPFPGLWQPFVPKAREWRINVVADKTFDVAIYTSPDAKDDWRVHQFSDAVEFKSEPFPDEQKARCFAYLGELGLKFGIFDFIEGNDGRITFLECNPNGQYGWLEERLGLPISAAIADEMVATARSAPAH